MSITLKQGILNYKPHYWQVSDGGNYEGRFYVREHSEEFDDVKAAVRGAQKHYRQEIETVERVQNVILYGQFVCREQYLATMYSSFKVVRKFLIIPKTSLHIALKYNLDARRLGYNELIFSSGLNYYIDNSKTVLVILVLTDKYPSEEFYPKCNNNYYIEYIINF